MIRRFFISSYSRIIVGSVVSFLALFPTILTKPGIRLLDDTVLSTIVAVSLSELAPMAGTGFLILFFYFAASYGVIESSGTRSRTISTAVGLGLGLTYTVFSVAIWVSPTSIVSLVVITITSTARIVLTSPLIYFIDPTVLTETISLTQSAAQQANALFGRAPRRPVRWPFYLFVAFVSVTAISDATEWLHTVDRLTSFVVRLVCATVALTFGLILAHNFFPGINTLPWQSETIAAWFLFHASVSVITLWLIRPITDIQSQPSLPSAIVIFLLVGVVIAALDGLYPIPELLLLGGAGLTLVERKTTLLKSTSVESWALDIESAIIDTISAAWQDSSKLFILLIAFQGFFISCWLLWLILFSVGSPLSGTSELTILSRVAVLLILSPLLAAGGYMIWFWVSEIQCLANRDGTSHRTLPRPPDLLLFPTMTVIGFLTFRDLIELHFVAGLLAILCTLSGVGAMIWSVRQLQHNVTLPKSIREHTIPIGFLIQIGGLQLSQAISPSPYGSEGSYLIVLLVTLVPLYLYPTARTQGIGRANPTIATIGLLTFVLVGTVVYLLQTAFLPVLTSSVIGVTAVGLAVGKALLHGKGRVQWAVFR